MEKSGRRRSRDRDSRHRQNVPIIIDHTPPPAEAEAADALSILAEPATTAVVPVAAADTALAPPVETNTDPFCHRSQMILLMNKNDSKKNTDSFNVAFAKGILRSVVNRKDRILSKVHAEKPNQYGSMSSALTAPLTSQGKRCSKFDVVTKMLNIWEVFKEISSLVNESSSTRSSSFADFISIMRRYERLASEAVEQNKRRFRAWRSDPMPAGENERCYLEGEGFALDRLQYPCCPNKNCGHTFIDQPPGNKKVMEDAKVAMETYMDTCRAFTLWKKKQGPQPVCPTTGALVVKMPSAPPPTKLHLRCHCSQLFADTRKGKQCPVGCVYEGVTFDVGRCPICLCTCNAFVELKKYNSIVIAQSLEEKKKPDHQMEARQFLDKGLNVNLMQQKASGTRYQQQMQRGELDPRSEIVSNIAKEGVLAQAMYISSNPPADHRTTMLLRDQVDAIEHPSGPSWTSVGDMNVHGRPTAGDRRRNNNGLLSEYVPVNMSEDQQLQQALAESGKMPTTTSEEEKQLQQAMRESVAQPSLSEAERNSKLPATSTETPSVILRTRKQITVNRRNNRATMSKAERKRAATVITALSRPRNPAYINTLMDAADLATPDRVDELMNFAEDMEE